jgi:hypothetical protein
MMAKEKIDKTEVKEEPDSGADKAVEAENTEQKVKVEVSDVDTSEKKPVDEAEVKQAFLKRFRQKKQPEKMEVAEKNEKEKDELAKKVEDKPIKPTVESAAKKQKGDKKEAKKLTSTDDLAEKLYRDIAKTQQKEYLVMRISKRSILFFGGVFLAVMWLRPITNLVMRQVYDKPDEAVTSQTNNIAASPTPTVEVILDERINDANILIRIRDNAEAGMASGLRDYLFSKGYKNIELYDDHGSQYTGLGVVVKPNATDLRAELEAIIGEEYQVSSPAAELTEDSQVDAVVLFGSAGEE